MMLDWVNGAVLIFRNLTEQRLKEASRIHSMKLESIGVLAAGIAHAGDGESKRAADLNEISTNSLVVCQKAYKYVAKLELELGDLPSIKVYPGDIGQVVVNLVVNAAQAIGDCKNKEGELGLIRLQTSCDDKWVTITVSDTGGGIPEGVRQRIFDPFFTTKNVGHGSGQGLAIIHDKHQGEIILESTVGQGTTFFIRLPITSA